MGREGMENPLHSIVCLVLQSCKETHKKITQSRDFAAQ